MPDPAATPKTLRAAAGSGAKVKRPSGAIASIRCPGCNVPWAHVEKSSPGARLMAIRSSLSSRPEQIEYDRRTSSPSGRVRRVRYCPGTKGKRLCFCVATP